MKTELIQLLDCEGDVLALYAYNGNLMSNEEAGRIIDEEWQRELSILEEANEGETFGPGDLDPDEALGKRGIERVQIEDHDSKIF